MSYLDNIHMMTNLRGNSKADSMRRGQANIINKSFKDSPNFKQIKIKSFDNSLRDVDVRVIQEKAQGSNDYQSNALLFRPYEQFKLGEYAIINNTNWILTDSNFLDDLMQKSIIELCNTSLKWQNSQGKILEYPCHIKPRYTSPISATSTDNSMILPSDNVRLAIIQNNADTLTIKRDDRFIFDNKAWKVTGTDITSYQGLLYITLYEVEISANDDMVNRIADYKVNQYSIDIVNGTSSNLTVNSTLQLNVVTKLNGVDTTLPIQFTSSNPSIATVNANGLITCIAQGNTTITASLTDSPSIQDTIQINVATVQVDSWSVTIDGADNITKSTSTTIKTSTYTGKVLNNGVVATSKSVIWSIRNEDGTTTPYATITSQTGLECVIQAGTTSGKNVVLRAEKTGEFAVYIEKVILIKALF